MKIILYKWLKQQIKDCADISSKYCEKNGGTGPRDTALQMYVEITSI